MALRRLLAVLAGALVLAIAYACTPFEPAGADPRPPSPPTLEDGGPGPQPDAASDDDSGAFDAGAPEWYADLPDGGNLRCVDFRRTDGSFTPTRAQRDERGWTITIDDDNVHKIRRTFTRPTDFDFTDVTVDMTVATGTINGDDYVDALVQIQGDDGSAESYNAFALVGGQGGDLNVWPKGTSQGGYKYHALPADKIDLRTLNNPLSIVTHWDPGGRFIIGPKAFEVGAAVGTGNRRKYTLEIGGRRKGPAPATTFTVRGLCLAFR